MYKRQVEEVTLVDFDDRVIKICERYFQGVREAFKDPRVEIVYMDGLRYVEEASKPYDVVVLDVTDIEDPHSKAFFSRSFTEKVKGVMDPGGILSAQAGCSHLVQYKLFKEVIEVFRSSFKYVNPYSVYIPSFGVAWGFIYSSQSRDMGAKNPGEIDTLLEKRGVETRFYDGVLHHYFANMRINIFE